MGETLKSLIKSKSKELGFQLVGITTPDPPPHFSVYQEWIQAGHHASMSYLETDRALRRRQDPCIILPECQSILVLGMRYPSPQEAPKNLSGSVNDLSLYGRIASFAWGQDYHDIIPPRLRSLVQFIESQVGHPIPNRYYTDTGPILERDLASRAGLGWIGKNTCLINPELGSYFFIAEILLGLELEPDPPFYSDHCGTCTRCIDACPTNCILPNRTLDASRCISYLTIENKGQIEYNLRDNLNGWIFGCDICQQVCPWNQRFSSSVTLDSISSANRVDEAFFPRDGLPRPNLLHDLELTPPGFNQKFKSNPVKRSKRRGYLRNIALALGSSGAIEGISRLSKILETEHEPLVRGHAVWALCQIGTEEAWTALQNAREIEQDKYVRSEIEAAFNDKPHKHTR